MSEMDDNIADFLEKYGPYFKEIRFNLLILLILFAIGSVVGFMYSQRIISFVLELYSFKGITIMTNSPYQYVNLAISLSFFIGFVTALPFGLYKLFVFFRPALSRKEKKLVLTFMPMSALLFLVGFLLGVWIIQYVINFYATVWDQSQVNSLWDIGHFFSQVLLSSILTGVIFQIPIVITFLVRLNIIKREELIKKRKYAYVILLIVGVLLPPTDIFSLILLTLPLFFLFEFGLLLNKYHA